MELGRGLVLPNPVTVASGTFGYGFEAAQMGGVDHLGGIFTKGTTLRAREGNPPPRIAEVWAGMLNSIGLQNPGTEVVARDYAPRWRGWRCPILVNVAGEDVDEYVAVCERLEPLAEIAGFELNISCPNIAHGLDLGTDPHGAARVTDAVRRTTEKPVIVKLTPNVTDIVEIGMAVQDAGADAVSAVNTYLGTKVSAREGGPVLRGAGLAGLSGPAIKPLALAAVTRLASRLSIPVIGIGGVASSEDVLEYLCAGAAAVQVGTANFYRPGITAEIIRELGEVQRAPRRPTGGNSLSRDSELS